MMTALSVYPEPKKAPEPKNANTISPPEPIDRPVTPRDPVDVAELERIARAAKERVENDPLVLLRRAAGIPCDPWRALPAEKMTITNHLSLASAVRGEGSFKGLAAFFCDRPNRMALIRKYLPALLDEEARVRAWANGTLGPLLSRAQKHAEYDDAVSRAVACERREVETRAALRAAYRLDAWDGKTPLDVQIETTETGNVILRGIEFDAAAVEATIRGKAIDLDALDEREEATKKAHADAFEVFRRQVFRWSRHLR